MAEMLMDGIGSGNNAIVDNQNRLWVNTNPIDSFIPVETDVTDTGSQYHCFEANNGNWYIRAMFASGGNVRTQQFRYMLGQSDFTGSWLNKTTLEFLNPGSVF